MEIEPLDKLIKTMGIEHGGLTKCIEQDVKNKIHRQNKRILCNTRVYYSTVQYRKDFNALPIIHEIGQ